MINMKLDFFRCINISCLVIPLIEVTRGWSVSVLVDWKTNRLFAIFYVCFHSSISMRLVNRPIWNNFSFFYGYFISNFNWLMIECDYYDFFCFAYENLISIYIVQCPTHRHFTLYSVISVYCYFWYTYAYVSVWTKACDCACACV